MSWYEWVFSGIGISILGWAIIPIKKLLERMHKTKENKELVKKQIKALDSVLEQQRIQDLPDIRYDNAYLFNVVDGFLQIKIINIGQPATIIEVRPQYSNWQYIGPAVSFLLPNRGSTVLQLRVPVIGNKVNLPDYYKIYIKIVDRHYREYSLAIEVTPNGIMTTSLIQI
ncbi:MAG: hypothetical protein HDS37_00860 [Bacteroides sp.]|nr:hypothetical protein [Bacteroides sp.]